MNKLITLLMLASASMAQSSADLSELQLRKEQLQMDLQKLDREMLRTDSLSRFEAQSFADQKSRYQMEIGRRKSELLNLQQKLAGVRSEIQKEQIRASQAKLEVENWNARIKFFQTELLRSAQSLEKLVATSLNWKKEGRMDRVRALMRDLEAGTASPEEGFGRLKSMYDEEIRFGDEIVLSEESIRRNNGALINVKLLRLGNVALYYTDDEGKYYGAMQKSSGDKWFEDIDFKQREWIRRAVSVKGGKLAPELSTLPLFEIKSQEPKQ